MEHLDLAGMITSPANWGIPAFDQQDAIYLSSSRQMLEPILEETSEDEENNQNSWTQYENNSVWSSESETGSVIRIELNKDPDSISERDFACPAKRARRDEFLIGGPTQIQPTVQLGASGQHSSLEDAVLLRKCQRNDIFENNTNLDRFIAFETNFANSNFRDSIGSQSGGSQHRSSGGSRRFDDFYSDSDSLSYHSLSRSSSLIQFESLERQMLNEQYSSLSSSVGNSSPSLLSFDGGGGGGGSGSFVDGNGGSGGGGSGSGSTSGSGNNSRRGSQSSLLKRYESSDGRLHQTYYDLNKIVFEDTLIFSPGSTKETTPESAGKSDSESSTSSSSGNSILSKPFEEDLSRTSPIHAAPISSESGASRVSTFQRGGKNSAENLSEDSGYCENTAHMTVALLRAKSKSIPKNFEKFCEEDEFYSDHTIGGGGSCSGDEHRDSAGCGTKSVGYRHFQMDDIAAVVSDAKQKHSKIASDSRDDEKNDYNLKIESPPPFELLRRPTVVAATAPTTAAAMTTALRWYKNNSRSPSSSPVSDACSTGGSCASASSFTWMQTTTATTPTNTNNAESISPTVATLATAMMGPPQFQTNRSSSLPDIRVDDRPGCISQSISARESFELAFQSLPIYRSRSCSSGSTSASASSASSEEEEKISSVPNDLDRIARHHHRRRHSLHHQQQQRRNSSSSSSCADLSDEFDVSTTNTGGGREAAAGRTADADRHHNYHPRRSRSWADRRDLNLLKFEAAESRQSSAQFSQSLGYMNASYNNLTLLDYSKGSRSRQNIRKSLSMENGSNPNNFKRNSRDSEPTVRRSSLLLDDIPRNFDRTISILTDECEESDVILLPSSAPKAPPRQRRKSSYSSCSDIDEQSVASSVSHLPPIKKPPRKGGGGSRKSLIAANESSADCDDGNVDVGDKLKESLPPASHTKQLQKTFDQDPTNLRTSYAQSLEKCNFDVAELTKVITIDPNTRMPKRRFQSSMSVQQKRTLVASTPNLNAYDPRSDVIEDDMFVSSAHTSMHHLPATVEVKRPLGILLPAGSRTSFGKEVSFCPVVSKYSWQEQSSEECSDHQQQQKQQHQSDDDENDDDRHNESETEAETSNNADSTVIPTGNLYKSNEEQRENSSKNIEENSDHLVTNEEKLKMSNVEREQRITSQTTAAPTIAPYAAPFALPHISIETVIDGATLNVAVDSESIERTDSIANNADVAVAVAHRTGVNSVVDDQDRTSPHSSYVLCATNKLMQTVGNKKSLAPYNTIPIREVEPQSRVIRMSSGYPVKCSAMTPTIPSAVMPLSSSPPAPSNNNNNNNNNELMKSKFKADEKHPSHKGFLARFANGFRFSLRRKKKQQLQQQQQPSTAGADISGAKKSESKLTKQGSPDFIYIPLKGPLPPAGGNRVSPCKIKAANNSSSNSSNSNAVTNHVLITGKPPLPKQQQQQQQQPPRVVGVCEKQQRAGQNAHHQAKYKCTSGGEDDHDSDNSLLNATNFSRSTFAVGEIDECFLENERRYYYDDFKNQLNGDMNGNGCAAPAGAIQHSSSSSVSQKAQMFNNMINNNGKKNGGGGGSFAAVVAKNNNCKIGLIETNLDTHETIISGKTRSLMELGPQQHQQQQQQQQQQNNIGGRYNFIKRPQAHIGVGGGIDSYHQHHYHHDEDVDNDDDDDDGARQQGGHRLLKVHGGCVSGGSTGQNVAASVRRPHKSMEFLLDKENQKNILPPENELQKSHDQNSSALSEHQLRVQASLQRLNIPDWFRQYNQSTPRTPDGSGGYKPGNFTRKRASDSGRWTGLNSKTTSLSSLGSQRSDRSPLLLSPSAHSHHGGQTTSAGGVVAGANVGTGAQNVLGIGGGGVSYGASGNFSRWSTSYLNSTQTSPSASQRGSFSRGGPVNSSFISIASGTSGGVRSSYRQPYLGWRSQEKLSQPRTPHERLASSLLAAQQNRMLSSSTQKSSTPVAEQQPVTPEIQSSIKEVTSAIVHYVNDQTNRTNQRSRSTSPNSRKCWLESSFVGIRPVESPQTPVIENSTFSNTSAIATGTGLSQLSNSLQTSYNSYNTNSSANSSIHSNIAATADVLRMNGVGAPERSMSSASLEDVLASLLGLPPTGTATTNDAYRSTTGDSVSEAVTFRMTTSASPSSLQVATDQRFRRRSEGDAPQQQRQQTQQKQQQILQEKLQQQQKNSSNNKTNSNAKHITAETITKATATATASHQPGHQPANESTTTTTPSRVSIGGDSTESKTTSELQVKCRNTKCDQTASALDAKKYYKSCHNCSHLYCSRECRRAHWEKHRKACLHSRASNLCRQVLSTCKDDVDSQRHLSLLARKGYLNQGRGVVRVLFRSAESAEGFIKHGFQCMGEASFVRWPDLMPAEMGLELYSELLKLSTEYKPDSKMLIYVAICVVSEAPGTAQAPVKWERQLVSRCAKLKLSKNVLIELEHLQHRHENNQNQSQMAGVPEHNTTEILILTFNPSTRSTTSQREVILTNVLAILNRRGVTLRKHYPEIYQRLQSYADGQTDRFNPVTLHPRDSQTGQGFVCIIMPVQGDNEIVKMPPNGIEEGGNRVVTIDVGGELIES